VLQALRYEIQQGYSNFTGRNGDAFADWAAAQLTSVADELQLGGLSGDSAQSLKLLAQKFTEYSRLRDQKERAEIINYATVVVNRVLANETLPCGQPAASSSFRSDRYGVSRERRDREEGASSNVHVGLQSLETPVMKKRGGEDEGVSADPTLNPTLNPTVPRLPSPSSARVMDELSATAHEEDTEESHGGSLLFCPPEGGDGAKIGRSDGPGGRALDGGQGKGVREKEGKKEQEEEEVYTKLNGRRVKSSTVAFRRSFTEAALEQAASSHALIGERIEDVSKSGQQRTAQWMSLRERRLTASAFSKALGFFHGDRVGLWEEKIGLRAPFAGNDATRWGTESEPHALSTYERLTGHSVEGCMFKVKHDDAPHGWLGASPDGLIGSLVVQQQQQQQQQQGNIPDVFVRGREENDEKGTHHTLSGAPGVREQELLPSTEGPGILEIKCPYNKGRPDLASPPDRAIWYYMPQLQGLMDVFDREWCTLFVWTPQRGSAAFLVNRNREYWAACFDVLADFWWAHVVPARQARERGASVEEIGMYRPSEHHPASEELKAWSKRLAAEAPVTRYPPVASAMKAGTSS